MRKWTGVLVVGCLVLLSQMAGFPCVAAADTPKKSPPLSVATPSSPSVSFPRPDLKAWIEDDGSIAIQNVGNADVSGPFKARVFCVGVQPESIKGRCAFPPFHWGQWETTIHMKPGYQQAPIKEQPGTLILSKNGPGWTMVYPAVLLWPSGSYDLAVKADAQDVVAEKNEANNSARRLVVRR